jgi:hypothetical protein
VRERLGVVHDPERARAVAAGPIRSAAEVKNNPPDLINVALEMLVKASLELPAFSTLDEMASRIRREVNTAIFEQVASRIGLPDRVRLDALLEVAGPAAKSPLKGVEGASGASVMVTVSRTGCAPALGRLARVHRELAGGDRGVEDRRLRRGGRCR